MSTGSAPPDKIDRLIDDGEKLPGETPADARLAYFERLDRALPDTPRIIFALAGAHDSAGNERDAARHYERAHDLGLPDRLMPQWYVQYGSTLRNNGDLDGAVRVLAEGQARFPDDLAIACFLALARSSAGTKDEALAGLLAFLVDHDGRAIDVRYTRSLRAYADDLRDHDPQT